jgi:hypothetical protein
MKNLTDKGAASGWRALTSVLPIDKARQALRLVGKNLTDKGAASGWRALTSVLPIDKARQALRLALEEGRYWLMATPTTINQLDSSTVERFYETGNQLIDTIVGAIQCGQHVALAGPRGCGKSYCVGEAIRRAQELGLLPENGHVKIQGNKELPRDYLIEDDVALKVSDKNVVTPERKDAPLFRFAERDGNGRPLKGPDGLVICHGRDAKGDLATAQLKPDQTLVLFLDEVNRFSDGVLDSLLLLLEEGEVIMGGEPFRMRYVVMMTMNPPGYDASARNLSPPLSARIGRQYRLLSPQLNVLTDTIAPPVIAKLAPGTGKIKLQQPRRSLLRRAAAATLCCWGDPDLADNKPGFEYLSREMRELIGKLAMSDPSLKAAMGTLNELCHFGPDARALIDWLRASAVAASNEAITLNQQSAEIRGRDLIETAITVLSHKVQDNFSSSSRPDNTRRKEEAIHVIVRALIDGGPKVEELLSRKVDDDKLLENAVAVIGRSLEIEDLRRVFLEKEVADDDAVSGFCAFIKEAAELDPPLESDIRALLIKLHLGEPVRPSDFAFSSEAYKCFVEWLSTQDWNGRKGPTPADKVNDLKAMLAAIAQKSAYPNTIGRYVERLRCVQDRVWTNAAALLSLIATAEVRATERSVLREVLDMIDYFWVRAEHYGPEVADQIKGRLDKLGDEDNPVPPDALTKIKRVVIDAARTMAEQGSRGSNSRRALRRLEQLMPPPAAPTTTGTG